MAPIYLGHISHQTLIFRVTLLVSEVLTKASLAERKHDILQFSVLSLLAKNFTHLFLHFQTIFIALLLYAEHCVVTENRAVRGGAKKNSTLLVLLTYWGEADKYEMNQ